MKKYKKIVDIPDNETIALYKDVQFLTRILEDFYKSPIIQACQDGTSAGQSVPHVHWHLMPRSTKQNNGIDIVKSETNINAKRSEIDMENEAMEYRAYIENFCTFEEI